MVSNHSVKNCKIIGEVVNINVLECQQYYLLVHFMRKLLIGNIQGQSVKSVKHVFRWLPDTRKFQ